MIVMLAVYIELSNISCLRLVNVSGVLLKIPAYVLHMSFSISLYDKASPAPSASPYDIADPTVSQSCGGYTMLIFFCKTYEERRSHGRRDILESCLSISLHKFFSRQLSLFITPSCRAISCLLEIFQKILSQ